MSRKSLNSLLARNDNHRRYVNAMPFADWLAHVDRRIQSRTGERYASNAMPDSYWVGLYHLGDSYTSAADNFIQDMPK